ncbi:Uncharacterised protein [uncultured Comamonas sp.]|nr:Uncharacterised protein [uncultured Comamonas sp.]
MQKVPQALIWKALAAIVLVVSGLLPASAQPLLPVPALTGHVIDQTRTLSDAERQALEARLAAIEQQHGSQVVVLMVGATAPEDIAAFANRVGNTWKIGRRNVGDGVLLIVAKDERRMRIEVAKALEGAIPDIAAARIIDGAMKPRFRDGDFAGGLQAAVEQIGARIAGEELPLPGDDGTAADDDLDWSDLAILLFFGVAFISPVARALFGRIVGGLLMGSGAGLLAFWITASIGLAAVAGLLALLYAWIFAGHGGGTGGGWSSGGWGGGSSGGGSWGSGGGGDFGGGGASGDW